MIEKPLAQHFPEHICRNFLDDPSQAKPGIHPFRDRLHVVTVVENPLRWRSRYWNYAAFEAMVEKSGAILYTVEVAFGDRCFEVTNPGNPHHLQLRTRDELLHKENALNVGVEKLLPKDTEENGLPIPGWNKVAWIDADVAFQRTDWAQETLQLLEHYKFLQMFSHAIDFGPKYEPLDMNESFVAHELDQPVPHLAEEERRIKHHHHRHRHRHRHHHGYYFYEAPSGAKVPEKLWHPGLAWACTREAWDAVGGLMDWVMGGSADHYMALALFNLIATEPKDNTDRRYLNLHEFPDGYRRPCLEWQHRCERFIRRNVGFMPGTVSHSWHGPKQKRQYLSRAKFLAQQGFDPVHHLKKDAQGLYALHDDGTVNYIKIRDGLRQYARLREEDSEEKQDWKR